jgi:N6-adenosine-specific RNA methylase IME4/ribosomal protein S27AE
MGRYYTLERNKIMSLLSRKEFIKCPECGSIELAEIKNTIPFETYIHECSKCEYIIQESEWKSLDKKYNIIYADPPWKFNNKNTGGSMSSGAANQYPVMKLEDIINLSVKEIADENCILFMWWVASMPEEALKVVKAWGFTLKTMTCFSWIKKTKNDKDFFGMGFYSRQQQEHCLIAVKGKNKILDHSIRQNVRAVNELHSKKPGVVREQIVKMVGDNPRIELFAREKVQGWDCWGNEV